ncbi:homeobox-containing protein, putative [Perkinsus marinus ATCC 50983]|uniref:Homeobox-containing protein, putative n=1 Tax=Perkinsus marinus (strain ATCC 50983 / TXsc) TaxID=423536 RepID=C5KKE2_PERM5|nr:homeobox-containing protein, putative [Perkinsus marinus ATCC 50983]EER15054.1 homeobox-containing protein, putative [Perkinsus marinus ATCC 50983]|eukprot:XP_002783258.1 homeobox-containing protein, putative [Perkinsus marinus ATCC 50983]
MVTHRHHHLPWWNASRRRFALPCEGYDITVGSVKEHFPVNPAFYRARAFTFRFRCSDDNFDDYVWLDMPEDFDDLCPPTYRGEIWVKALPVKPYRLPESDYYYEEDPEIEAAIAAYRSQFSTASNDCGRPKKKPTISPRGNSVPPSKGYGHQSRQGELDADLMDFGGGHHRTVSNPPSSSSVYPGITSRSSNPAAPQVRAEDLDREALKAARLKAKEERIRAKHEEFASRQREEATKREAKLDAQGRLAEELDHWAYTEQGKPKDIRTLLSNMEEALWPNSGWSTVSAGELMVNTGAVKKAYRKAIILCHPDRHQSASPDEQYRADRIFNALNEAFKRQ